MASNGLKIEPVNRIKEQSGNRKTEISFDFLNKELFPKKQNDKKKEIFFVELAAMLEAGIDIKESFEIIIEQQKSESDKSLFIGIKETLINGASLSESLKRTGQFTAYEYYCIQIGEESGRMVVVLTDLARFFQNKIKIRKQIFKSLSYPMAVLITSIIALIFMLVFVIPMFSDVFKRFGSDLPALTKFFVSLSQSFKNHFLIYVIILFIVMIPLLLMWKKPRFKVQRQVFIHKIPVIGDMVSGIYLSRMCASFALLTTSHVPLIQTIRLVREMIEYAPLTNGLTSIEQGVENGQPFYESMKPFKVFDAKMISLIKIGEETNKMGLFFEKLHHRFSDEVESRTTALNTFLEPIIIAILGIVIGIMLVAMYLPMFKLSTSVG